ncbi:hypothetical protein [Methylobacterium radiotolerans]
MSEPDPSARRAATVERLMQRLNGFMQGVGMSGADPREIINRVIASEPSAGDGDLMAKARG